MRHAYRNAVPHISEQKDFRPKKATVLFILRSILQSVPQSYTATSEEIVCCCCNLLLLFLCSESRRKTLLSGGLFLLLLVNRKASSSFSLRGDAAIWSRSRWSRSRCERCSRRYWSPVPCRHHLRLVRCCGWPRLIGNRQRLRMHSGRLVRCCQRSRLLR
jgi:hypothetical protein